MENLGPVRKAIEFHKRTSDVGRQDDTYRLDRNDAEDYFGILPKWRSKLINYFDSLHEQGEKVVHVDICGRASARSLGADKSYFLSLNPGEFRKAISHKGDVFIDGDVFSPKDFLRLKKRLEEDGARPALVTFKPVAGLQNYFGAGMKVEGVPNYKEITHARLEKRLEEVVAILRPGGYVFLERPFQFDSGFINALEGKSQNEFDISIALKRIAKRLKCKIEIASVITGPYFLLHKKE